MDSPKIYITTVAQVFSLLYTSLLLSDSHVHALTFPEYEICPSRTKTIQQNSNFIIRHNTQTSQVGDQTCTLTLSGFTSGGYVALLGVTEVGSGDPCPGGLPPININSETYCVGDYLKVDALRLYETSEMTISIDKTFQSFAVKVYSNFVKCGTDAVIDSATLSGVISSAIPGNHKVDHESCSTTISGLPNGSIVKLRKLSFTVNSGQVKINDGAAEDVNDRTLKTSGTTLDFDYIEDLDADEAFVSFTLLYSVLVCENPPAVGRANILPFHPSVPYLAGSMVTQYACIDNFIFRDSNSTSIRCVVENLKARWTPTDDIKCIPEPRCLEKPKIVVNTIQNRIDDHTVQYSCAEGYPGSQDSIVAECSSTDPEQSPWVWSDDEVGTTLNCTPVECEVLENFRNITHGTVAVNTTYTYQERLNVMCDFTYAQNPEEIVCTSDGTWSGMPTCLSTIECVWDKDVTIDNGELLHTYDSRYYEDDEVQYSCEEGYEQSGSITCLRSGQFSTDEIKCKKEGLTSSVIAAIAVTAAVVVIIIVAAILVYCIKFRRRSNHNRKLSENLWKTGDESSSSDSAAHNLNNNITGAAEPLYSELEPPDVIHGHRRVHQHQPQMNPYAQPGSAGQEASPYGVSNILPSRPPPTDHIELKQRPPIASQKPKLSFKQKFPIDDVYTEIPVSQDEVTSPPSKQAPKKPPRLNPDESTLPLHNSHNSNVGNNNNRAQQARSVELQANDLYEGTGGGNSNNAVGSVPMYDNELYE